MNWAEQSRRIELGHEMFASGEAIEMRCAESITRARICAHAGFSPKQLREWERGRVRPSNRFVLAWWDAIALL